MWWTTDGRVTQWLRAGYSHSQNYSMKLFHYSSAIHRRCLLSLCRTTAAQLSSLPTPSPVPASVPRWCPCKDGELTKIHREHESCSLRAKKGSQPFFWIRTKILQKKKKKTTTFQVEKLCNCMFCFVFKFLILPTLRCRSLWSDGLCHNSSTLN